MTRKKTVKEHRAVAARPETCSQELFTCRLWCAGRAAGVVVSSLVYIDVDM